MSSSNSSPLPTPSKSKKPLHSTPISKPSSPLTTQTPDKPQLPPRLRNRNFALSIKEVRKIAQSAPGQSQTQSSTKSARRQISSWPDPPTTSTKQIHKPAHDNIPAKYEMLAEFFDCLDASIRLSRLKGSMSSFTNICPKIESLTNRRFSYSHLAQLKYILPEAIDIKRVLKFDDRTCCMKPDLHISINVNAVECDGRLKSESKNVNLRKVFRSRLADFYKAHPEGDDIPEELLPEPFNQSKQDLNSEMTKGSASLPPIDTSADERTDQDFNSSLSMGTLVHEEQRPVVASHLPTRFRRYFSQTVTKITQQSSAEISPQQSVLHNPEPCRDKNCSIEEASSSTASLIEVSTKPTQSGKNSAPYASPGGAPIPCLLETPSKEMFTHGKLASTPSLMSTTPGLQTPKRCHMSPDDADSISSPDKLVRRPPRPRSLKSLKFETPVKNAEDERNEMEATSVDDDILKIFPESLLKSIMEKERKVKEEQDPAISQAKWRQQMVARLPKLFDMIHFFFQSIKQSVVTKEELMHKIIASNFDIVDAREVEEQITLLLELVPEWISEKLTSGGDLLLCINKMSNPESIRARLKGAK